MTNNEIVKALECCQAYDCGNCPLKEYGFSKCKVKLSGNILHLIHHQKLEAIKEFVEKFREVARTTRHYVTIDSILTTVLAEYINEEGNV